MNPTPRSQQSAQSKTSGSRSNNAAPAPQGILMKQSSFSKNKNPAQSPSKPTNGAVAGAPGGPQPVPPPQPQGPPPAARTATTPQTAAKRPPGAAATPQANPVARPGAVPPAAMPGNAAARGAVAGTTPSMGAGKSAPPPGAAQRPAGGQQGPFKMGGAPSAASPAAGATRAAPAAANAGAAQRQPVTSNPYGSMGPGSMPVQGPMGSTFGSMGAGQMGGNQGYGSMAGGQMGMMGSMGPQGFGSMGPNGATPGSMGPGGYGSMGQNAMGGYGSMGPSAMGGYGSMGQNAMGGYGSMGPGQMGSMGPQAYGSMGANGMQGGSMYGGSMMGGNSLFGSQFGSMGPMYMGGAGSLYGMPGVNRSTSAYGFTAQWGSLANMSSAPDRSGISRSDITSTYGGFESETKNYRTEDLCPNIGTLDEGKPVKRSGRRGGNHLYTRNKNDRSAPVITSNSKVTAMTIKRKDDADKSGKLGAGDKKSESSDAIKSRGLGGATGSSGRLASDRKSADGKLHAKLPANYDLHTLFVVDKASNGKGLQVKDPNTVVLEKDGKKETFETDEAILREKPTEDIDSVLLSSVLTSWHGGHNSSLLIGAGKGKTKDSIRIAHDFVKGAVERLEKTSSSNYFDISVNMVSIKGSNQGCDLLKSGASYEKLQLGSSPVYGPCLLGLETKVVKTGKACVEVLEKGISAAKEAKEIVAAFLVLKQAKKGGDKEVRLSSLCIGYVREELNHLTDMKERNSNSPYQLFRYAIGGASVCVSVLVLSGDDATARTSLDVERKMREVKNRVPRSGNLQKFIEYTQKEITRMKDKAASGSESEKKRTEAQIKKMEDMISDTKKILDDPENAKPSGYPLPS